MKGLGATCQASAGARSEKGWISDGNNQVSVNSVESLKQFVLASKLVHDQYSFAGLMSPTETGLRLFLKDFLRSATTFVAVKDQSVVCTATAKILCPAGLPSDALYSHEIQRLVEAGRLPMESSL